MFSFLRTKRFRATSAADFGDTHAKRMDLEERKAYRREMLSQSICETFLSMEVISSMYKLELVPVDRRHHRFAGVIDVTKGFPMDDGAQSKSFAATEALMRATAEL